MHNPRHSAELSAALGTARRQATAPVVRTQSEVKQRIAQQPCRRPSESTKSGLSPSSDMQRFSTQVWQVIRQSPGETQYSQALWACNRLQWQSHTLCVARANIMRTQAELVCTAVCPQSAVPIMVASGARSCIDVFSDTCHHQSEMTRKQRQVVTAQRAAR